MMAKRIRNDPSVEEESMMMTEAGVDVVGQSLAPQLGSDAEYLAQGKVDMRKLSVIGKEDIPFLLYANLRGRKVRTWRDIHDYLLNIFVSVGGRGRKDIIRMEGVSKGGLPPEPEPEQPGWFSRNILRKKPQVEDRL